MLFYLLCGAWFTGILLGRLIPADLLRWLLLAAIALAALLIFRGIPTYRVAFLSLLALVIGGVRFQANLPVIDPAHIAYYNDLEHRSEVTGVIIDDPVRHDENVELVIATERIWIPGLEHAQPINGCLLVFSSRAQTWAYGDWVQVTGDIESPPSGIDFDYAAYLVRDGIHSWIPTANVRLLAHDHGNPLLQTIYSLRSHFLQVILRIFPDPEALLLSGILLGVESGISQDVQTAFNRTGTTHIIAISGFNLTLLAQASIRFSGRWLGRRKGSIAAVVVILLYTVMVGAQPAVVRAAIMASLGLLARYLGRVNDALRALGIAACLMTAIDPYALWDVGFQLSFAATLGLILYADPLQRWAERALNRRFDPRVAQRAAPLLGEYALFTLAAQITTLPITAIVFHRISLVSLAANITILPLQPGLMFLGGAAMLAGAIFSPPGQMLAWLAWPFAAATIRIVQLWSGLSSASIPIGEFDGLLVIGYYSLLFGTTYILSRLGQRPDVGMVSWVRKAFSPALLLSGLFLASLLAWHALLRRPDGQFHVHLLNVGSGDSILIDTPGGGRILIDGGPSSNHLTDRLSHYSSLFDKQIDWLILAGKDYDQLGGLLGLVKRFPVERALIGVVDPGSTGRRVLEELNQHSVETIEPLIGSKLDLGQGAVLEVLSSGPQGLLLVIDYNALQILLTPGADPSSIQRISQRTDLRYWSVIMLPACGDPAVVPESWLSQLSAVAFVLSCEAGTDPFSTQDLPPPVTNSSNILRTNIHGDLTISSDGTELWIDVERTP